MSSSRFIGVVLAGVLAVVFGSITAKADHRGCGYGFSIGGYRHYANYSSPMYPNVVRYARPNYYYSVPTYPQPIYNYYPAPNYGYHHYDPGHFDVHLGRGGLHLDFHGGHHHGYHGHGHGHGHGHHHGHH